MFRCILTLMVLILFAASADAQRYQQNCPGGNCPLQSSIVPAVITDSKTTKAEGWFRHESGFLQEWKAGYLVRTVWLDTPEGDEAIQKMSDKTREALALPVVGKKVSAPVDPLADFVALTDGPIVQSVVGDDPFPGGVKIDRIPQEVAYVCNGVKCDKNTAFQSLLGTFQGALVDDRHKMFLTVVGDDRLRSAVLRDLNTSPALAAWRGKLHANFYSPGDWQVTQVGLAPGVTLQSPLDSDGKSQVLWRLPDYDGDAVALAEYVRKADPSYRPESDPNPSKPAPVPAPVKPDPSKPDGGGDGWSFPLRHVPMILIGGGVVAILILMIRKK